MQKIVVTSKAFSKNEKLRKKIKSLFPNTILNDESKLFSKNELIDLLNGADGAIIGLEEINKELLESIPTLKIISKFGVGLDNINVNDCKGLGVSIGWTGGVNKTSVAEMALGFMLMFSRNLYVTSNQMKNGIWNKSGGFQLTGKTIGIIGMGYIGKELVNYLKPFRCKILVNDIIEQDDYYKKNNLEKTTKECIYKQSDIITIHVPLTEETKDMITLKELNMMKETSYLINTARGSIVNENDLKIALKGSFIAGAALDVYSEEPPVDAELLSLPNLICTPHIGGNSIEAVEAMGMSAIKHLCEYFNKE